jgi:hypothetical protein
MATAVIDAMRETFEPVNSGASLSYPSQCSALYDLSIIFGSTHVFSWNLTPSFLPSNQTTGELEDL